LGELFSVIVTTYNREDALDAVLRSLARQSEQDFEVVVAGDRIRARRGLSAIQTAPAAVAVG